MSRSNVKSLVDVLESHAYSVNRNVRMSDMKCQGYFNTGKTILRRYFDYYRDKSYGDTEYLSVRKFTGRSNREILENIRRMFQTFDPPKIVIRIPSPEDVHQGAAAYSRWGLPVEIIR